MADNGQEGRRGAAHRRWAAGLGLALFTLMAQPGPAQILGEAPIIEAVRANDTAEITRALLNGASVHTRTARGMQVLILAAQLRHAEAVQTLITAGARTDDRGPDGETALTEAAKVGDVAIVQILLAAGADADRPGTLGETALIKAARARHVAVVRTLIEAGADPSYTDRAGQSARDIAEQNGARDIVALIDGAG